VVARSTGTDVTTGAGLDTALGGVEAVIDVTNTAAQDAAAARRTLTARGQSVRLIPSRRAGLFSVEMAGEVLLPGPDARLAPTTFDAWLAAEATPGS